MLGLFAELHVTVGSNTLHPVKGVGTVAPLSAAELPESLDVSDDGCPTVSLGDAVFIFFF